MSARRVVRRLPRPGPAQSILPAPLRRRGEAGGVPRETHRRRVRDTSSAPKYFIPRANPEEDTGGNKGWVQSFRKQTCLRDSPPQTPHPQKPPLPKAAAARGTCRDFAKALALETDSRSCTGELQENNKPTSTLLYSLDLFLRLRATWGQR